MNENMKPSEAAAVLAAKGPSSIDNTTIVTAYVLPNKFGRIAVFAQISGALDVTAAVRLYKASDTNGTGSATVATAALATTTATERQNWINHEAADGDADKPYLMAEVEGANTSNTVLASVALLGFAPRYAPASDNDASTVVVS